jgi:hypothetical protein
MRKTPNCLLAALLAGTLAFVGCGKSNTGTVQGTPPPVDMPKFVQAFPTPTPDQQANLSKMQLAVRYGQYPEALVALDKLAQDASLTEPQKKAVNDLIEGLKQKLATVPTAPPK